MRKLVIYLLVILLWVTACTTQEFVVPPTSVVIEETVTAQMTITPVTTNALTLPSATPVFTPLATTTLIASPVPTQPPTATPLSVPTSEFANSEVQFSLVDQFGGRMQAIDVVGDKAYVGVGPRLQVIDIADPNSPQFLGQSEAFPSLVQDIDIEDDIAYVAFGKDGVRIMDISNPTNIKVIGAFGSDVRQGIFDFTVDENILYDSTTYLGIGGRVYLYDVTDVSNPIHLTADAHPAPSVSTVTSPVILDGYLYTIGEDDLNIFSYDAPLMPKLEGSVKIGGSYSYFTIVDNLLYLISYAVNTSDVLMVIDISDPTEPFVMGELKIDEPRDPRGIVVANGYAYVIDNQFIRTPCEHEVYIYDVSDPAHLQEVNHINQAVCSNEFVPVGNQLYVAQSHQMQILDLSNPTELTEIGHYAIPLASGQPTRILTVNNNAYVFEAINETLSIWDISNSHTPSALASPTPFIGGGSFSVANDLLYVPGWAEIDGVQRNRFRVYSLEDTTQPELIMDELRGVYTATGEPADYIATYDFLELVNSDGLPLGRAIYRDPEIVHYREVITRADQYIYIGSGQEKPDEPAQWQLEIYDATDPAGLELVGNAPIPGEIRAITAKDNYVYVIWGDGELLVIDVSSMSSPQIVAKLPLPPNVTVATIRDDYLYFGVFEMHADPISGLYAINISTPSHPYLAGFKQLAGGVQSIAQVDDLFYIASGYGGVHLLETNQ